MTNRERVIKAINFQQTDYLPYEVGFTQQLREKVIEAYGEAFINSYTNNITLYGLQGSRGADMNTDEYGVFWDKSGADKDIGVPAKYHIQTEEDFEKYEWPPIDEAFIREQSEALMKTDPNNFRALGIGFTMYERLWTLMSIEETLANMVCEPELCHGILEQTCRRIEKMLDIALEYNYDGFYFGDDWGQQQGLIMGPAHWRTFIKPYMARLYKMVRESGKYVIQHSCGDIREIMEDAYEIGLNVYQTFQPEIYGLDYSKKLHGKIAIWGGISTQNDLPTKTLEEIRNIVRTTIAHFRNTGGIIIAPTHSMPADIPVENVKAMVEEFLNQEGTAI